MPTLRSKPEVRHATSTKNQAGAERMVSSKLKFKVSGVGLKIRVRFRVQGLGFRV